MTTPTVNYLTPELIATQVKNALSEDLGDGDLTAILIPNTTPGKAVLLAREPGIFCGSAWFLSAFTQISSEITCTFHISDGDAFTAKQILATLEGPLQAIVSAERTALNFVQLLSGTATITATYVEKLRDSHAKLYDTRKTIPGLRLAQKYAVRCGGGYNHRLGLWDAILLKENHLRAFPSPDAAIQAAKTQFPFAWIEIEVETLEQLKSALSAAPDRILLDNFTLPLIHKAVITTAGQCPLEVSGGITLESIGTIAASGVDVISCGALTKHVRAIDLSLLVS